MKSFKSTLYIGAIASMAMSFAPQAYADSSMHKSMEHHSQASSEHKEIMGKGIVHSIDLENKKINISHKPIPALKWPEMTMDLDVSKGVDLEALSPDDVIEFHIELGEDKIYRITKIMKAEVYDWKYLKHSEGKYICMVNNKLFDKEQIPTEVNGKTYYGCCSMCKAKLEKSQELREAIDPISGNIVDKASASIGTGPDGKAYYFENEKNMKKYDESQSSSDPEKHNHKH